MRQGRDEKLLRVVGVKENAIKEAFREIVKLTAIASIILMLAIILLGIYIKAIIISMFWMAVILLLSFFVFVKLYEQCEIERLNISYVDKILTEGQKIKIYPTERNYHNEFLTGIADFAKIYAKINKEDFVDIYIKFNDKEKLVYLESVGKGYFTKYYFVIDMEEA